MKRGRPKGTTKGGLKYLNEGQLKAFFQGIRKTKDAVRKTRDDLIFSLIVFYGLRVCELARSNMGDLDLRGRQLCQQASNIDPLRASINDPPSHVFSSTSGSRMSPALTFSLRR